MIRSRSLLASSCFVFSLTLTTGCAHVRAKMPLIADSAVSAAKVGTVTGIVATGKRTVRRERPNARDDKSFPSGHSSAAFSSALLIQQDLSASIKRPWLRRTIKAGTYSSAAAVAWARVEANEHHLVDVLFSAALSNFVIKTFYKSMNSENLSGAQPVQLEAGLDSFAIKLNYKF